MDPVVAAALRGALALLFASAAWHKLSDREAFAGAVAAYRLLPAGSERVFATLLATLEGATALALAAPIRARPGALLALCLLGLYTSAIVWNLARGRRDLDCGCMGRAARQPIGGAVVLRNALLAGATLVCLAPVSPRSFGWLDGFTTVAAIASASALYAAVQRMMATAPALRELRQDA